MTWDPHGTLASFLGPGYVRNLGCDEEGRVTSIRRGSTLAFEYAYGFDGGRRWRKDLANDEWDWYPCGVACGSGELVEMRSDLSGGSWSVESTSLTGVRAGESFLVPGLSAPIARALGADGSVTATPLLDAFGVMRGGSLPEDPLRKLYGGSEDEGTGALVALLQLRPGPPRPKPKPKPRDCAREFDTCNARNDNWLRQCEQGCTVGLGVIAGGCAAACAKLKNGWLVAGCLLGCGIIGGGGLIACFGICNNGWEADRKRCEDAYSRCRARKATPSARRAA